MSRLRVFLAFLLVVSAGLSASFAVFAMRQAAANPQVPRGGSASFPSTGTLAAANSESWDVVSSGGSVVAKASVPQGWTASLSGSTLTVSAPSTAAIATNYTVRYGSGGAVGGGDLNSTGQGGDGYWGGAFYGAVGARSGRVAMVSPQPSGSRSAPFDVVAGTTGGVPGAPTGVSAFSGDYSTSVRWTPVAGATSYRVWYGTSSGVYGNYVTNSYYSDSYTLILGLPIGVKQYIVVDAVNASGASSHSAEVSVTPVGQPTGVTATPGAGSVTLSWTASTAATGYRIEYGTHPNDGSGPAAPPYPYSFPVTGTSATIYGLTGGTTYYFAVSGTNRSAEPAQSPRSAEVSATPTAGPSTPPGSVGNEFWLAVPGSGPNGALGYYLYVTSAFPTSGTVSVPGTGFSQDFAVGASGVATVVLPPDIELTQADGVESKAIRVVAGAPVGVQVLDHEAYASEGFAALPTSVAGTAFVVSSYPSGSSDPNFPAYSQVAVVATQSATTLTITPKVASGSRAAGVPYSVVLNQGEAYQFEAVGALLDLTGTVVTSDKPVVAFTGNRGASVPNGMPTANPLMESLPSVDRLGMDFAFVPLATRQGDVMRVVAAFNGTVVTVNGTTVATLSTGGSYEAVVSSASAVSASKPAFVQQLSRGWYADQNSQADPFSVTVPALTQYGPRAAFNVPESSKFAASYVNVVVPSSAVGDLRLDSTIIPGSSFASLGSTGYAYARLSASPGAHVLSTPNTGAAFGATVYGFGGYDGYGYPAALGLPSNGTTYAPPAAPTDLVATSVSGSEIDLSWSSSAMGVSGFRIERKTGAGGTWAAIDSVAANARAYANVGLAESTTYVYRLVAISDLDSAPSNEASATTVVSGPPNAATNLTASAPYEDEVNLAWIDTSSSETGFRIERDSGDGHGFVFLANAGANASRFSDTTVNPSSTYAYRVLAYNGIGNSTWSNVASTTTPPTPPVGAPTYLKSIVIDNDCLVSGSSSTATVMLSSRATINTRVSIRSTNPVVSVPGFVMIAAGARQQSFPISARSALSLSVGNVYASSGGWVQRARVSAVPSVSSLAVPAPTLSVGSGGIWLSWTSVDDALGSSLSGYAVYRKVGSSWVCLNTKPTTSGSYVDPSPSTGPNSYYVSLLRRDGSAVMSSPISTVTYSGPVSGFSWRNPPRGSLSGTILLEADNPDASQEQYTLYVDGREMGAGVSNLSAGGSLSATVASLNTCTLNNGTHTVWLASEEGAPNLFVSQVITITTSNALRVDCIDGIADLPSGELSEFGVTAPDNPGNYTISIKNENGTTVRSWTGFGREERVDWDGADSNGDVVADGEYAITISTGEPGDDRFGTIYKVGNSPTFLSIVMIPGGLSVYTEGALSVRDAIRGAMRSRAFGSYVVMAYGETTLLDLNTIRKIKRWMSTSVDSIYVFGHGAPSPYEGSSKAYVRFCGNVRIYNGPYGHLKGADIIVPEVVGDRQYHFVMLDACNTAGSNPTHSPADEWGTNMTRYVNAAPRWASAFNLDTTPGYYEGALVCFNGEVYFPMQRTFTIGGTWIKWLSIFWVSMGNGNTVSDSITQADLSIRGISYPDPGPSAYSNSLMQPKRVFYGDYQW